MSMINQINETTFKTRLCRHTNGYKEQFVITFKLPEVYPPDIAICKAQEEREKLDKLYHDNIINPPKYSKTVEDVYINFIEEYKVINSPETADLYFGIIKKDIIPVVKKKAISNIDQCDLENFVNRLIKNDPAERPHSTVQKSLSAATIRRYETCFCELMHWCVKNKYAPRYPFDRKEVSKPKIEEKVVKYYSPDDYWKLFNELLSSDLISLQDKILVCLDGLAGLRRGEIVALTWEDWEGDKLMIRKAAVRPKGSGQIEKSTKTYLQRVVYIPVQLQDLLKEYRETLVANKDYKPSNKILRGKRTKDHLNADVAGERIKKITGLMVGDPIHTHGLRHTYASVLNSNNVSIDTIRDNLGHKNISTTMRYVHTYDEAKKASSDTLSALLNTNKDRGTNETQNKTQDNS